MTMLRYAILFFVQLILFDSKAYADINKEDPSASDFTAALRYASDYLLKGLNDKIQPCQDFYAYACGGRGNVTTGSETDDWSSNLTLLMEQAFAAAKANNNSAEYVTKTLSFYDQCFKGLNQTSKRKFEEAFNAISKIFPRLGKGEKLDPTNSSFWNTIGKLQKHFTKAVFFDFEITALDGHEVILIKPPPLGAEVNTANIDNLMQLLNQIHTRQDVQTRIDSLSKLHYDILNTISDQSIHAKYYPQEAANQGDNFTKSVNGTNLNMLNSNATQVLSVFMLFKYESHLQEVNPELSWSDFLDGLFEGIQEQNNSRKEIAYGIRQIHYFKELPTVLAKHASNTIYDYIILYLWNSFHSALFAEYEAISTVCKKHVMKYFASAAVRMIFDHKQWDILEWRADLNRMFETIRASFKFLATNADWLHWTDYTSVIEKTNQIKYHPGIPEWLVKDDEVNRRTFDFNSTYTFTENAINVIAWPQDQHIKHFFCNDTEAEEEPSFEVNAYYLQNMNIHTKLGIILPPAYHPRYPVAVKYGILGYVLGHELMHAFDRSGVLYSAEKGKVLLSNKSKEAYNKRTDCLEKQLFAYCYKKAGECVDGKYTLREAMADIDGLKLAYMAYKFVSSTQGDDPPVTHLINLSSTKIFFLAFGRIQCAGFEGEHHVDLEDVHPPSRFRLQFSVRNFRPFVVAHNCSLGIMAEAPMKVCRIWGDYYSANRLL